MIGWKVVGFWLEKHENQPKRMETNDKVICSKTIENLDKSTIMSIQCNKCKRKLNTVYLRGRKNSRYIKRADNPLYIRVSALSLFLLVGILVGNVVK